MKNDECTIYFVSKSSGKVVQSFRKEKYGWVETSSKGIKRPCTAEQFISHLLPTLAFGHVDIKVKPDRNVMKNSKNSTNGILTISNAPAGI